MTDNDLPAAIRDFIGATNRGDSDAFAAAFTEDAYLNDRSREFHGHDGVRLEPHRQHRRPIAFEIVGAEPGTSRQVRCDGAATTRSRPGSPSWRALRSRGIAVGLRPYADPSPA